MKEKNKYGQYFTEEVVAEFMVSLITHDKTSKVLEPSCGKGVFLKKLSEYGFSDQTARIGIEQSDQQEYEEERTNVKVVIGMMTDSKCKNPERHEKRHPSIRDASLKKQ